MRLLLIGAATVAVLTPLLGARWVDRPELAWLRDRWLLGMAVLGVLALGMFDSLLAAMIVAPLAWCRHPKALPSVMTWAGIAALWVLAGMMSPRLRALVVLGWVAVAVFQSGLILIQWWTDQRPMGTFGHRTLVGAFLALCLPLALATHWSVALILGVGLVLSCSWVAWVASALALAWLYPWTGLLSGAAALGVAILAWPSWTMDRSQPGRDVWIDRQLSRLVVRGVGLDGVRARSIAWLGLMGSLTWRGHGPGSTSTALMHGNIRAKLAGIHGGHAHNDVLEYLYDYGALGACVVGVAAWRILPSLRLGDPVSASVLAGLVLMQGTYLLRVPTTGAPWCCLAAWAVSA